VHNFHPKGVSKLAPGRVVGARNTCGYLRHIRLCRATALITLTVSAAIVPVAPAAAGVGGVTDISDRQEAASCAYARGHASPTKRSGYARACRAAADAERGTNAVAAAAGEPFTYENPVYGSSFPDPGAFANGSTDYYAYATGGRFPIIKSSDLVHWEVVGHAFSARPSWVVQSGDWHPWAPSVLSSARACPGTTSPGCYFMYYVGLSGQHTPTTHCVGVAWSLTPAGPFTDLGPLQAEDGSTDAAGRPAGCGDAEGYSNIDPAPFTDDDGSAYLYLSTGRRCATPTTGTCPYNPAISVVPLTETPTKASGPRKLLFGGTPGGWEQEPGTAAAVVENPWMEKRGESYYLFYSGGSYLASYGMGYATSASPAEGFAKSPLNPILAETDEVLSPGGGSVTPGPGGESWLVYHGRAGAYAAPRTMRIDPVYWSGTTVFTPAPTAGPQPFPPEEPPVPPPSEPPPSDPPPAEPSSSSPPDPPAAPVEMVAPPDLTPPSFGLRFKRTRGRLRIVAGPASEDAWVTITGRVRIAGSRRSSRLRAIRARFIPAGDTAVLRVRLPRRAVRVVLTIVTRDAAGNTTAKKRTIRLRR
jgi:hypothetical protein